MSARIGNVIIIETVGDAECEECHAITELRPYGRFGACLCWDCAEKIPEIRDHNMRIQLFGEPGELIG